MGHDVVVLGVVVETFYNVVFPNFVGLAAIADHLQQISLKVDCVFENLVHHLLAWIGLSHL